MKKLSIVRSLLVLAIGAAVAGPGPVQAHNDPTDSSHSYRLEFRSLKCLDDTLAEGFADGIDFNFDDEPYVVMFVANLATRDGRAIRTKVFSGVNKGETVFQTKGLFSDALPGENPANLVVLTAVLEHDQTNVETVRTVVENFVRGTLVSTTNLTSLRSAMDTAITLATDGAGDQDDRIGGTRALTLSAGNIIDAHNGTTVTKSLEFTGKGAIYRTGFRLRRN